MMTDVLVHHGSTDAPTVDIYESDLANATIVSMHLTEHLLVTWN